jgi:hypothetical protein
VFLPQLLKKRWNLPLRQLQTIKSHGTLSQTKRKRDKTKTPKKIAMKERLVL